MYFSTLYVNTLSKTTPIITHIQWFILFCTWNSLGPDNFSMINSGVIDDCRSNDFDYFRNSQHSFPLFDPRFWFQLTLEDRWNRESKCRYHPSLIKKIFSVFCQRYARISIWLWMTLTLDFKWSFFLFYRVTLCCTTQFHTEILTSSRPLWIQVSATLTWRMTRGIHVSCSCLWLK